MLNNKASLCGIIPIVPLLLFWAVYPYGCVAVYECVSINLHAYVYEYLFSRVNLYDKNRPTQQQ